MTIPPTYSAAEAEAFRLFSKAACRQTVDSAEAAELAQRSLSLACRADDELLRSYALQMQAMHQRAGQLPVVLGCGVTEVPEEPDESLFDAAFTAAAVPIRWPQVEADVGQYDWTAADRLVTWAREKNLLIRGGPLLDFRDGGLPDWLRQWSHDLPSLQSFLCDFVETAVARYRGAVRFWEVVAGAAKGGEFEIGEEDRLTLAARVIEAARRADDDSHVVIRVSDPWGHYQNEGQHKLTPMQFVDALSRSGLGLGIVDLELDLRGIACTRAMSDISRLVDMWSVHGLPLQVTIRSCPQMSPDEVRRWATDFLPLLMAMPTVTGVFWSAFKDTSESAESGVLASDGEPKPVHEILARHQQATE